MANIAIYDLDTSGLDLFMDSEGFMSELTEDELTATNGGFTTSVTSSGVCVGVIALGSSVACGAVAVGAAAVGAGYLYGRYS